ncbi:MAG: hypothetical protein JXR91_11910 [Deltaproteobacteria bacterium]|nr:hypothetical protein [Deltaproteobacteria bacterium]
MSTVNIILTAIPVLFAIGAGTLFSSQKSAVLLKIPAYISALIFLLFIPVFIEVFLNGTFLTLYSNIVLDPLAAYHIFLVNIIFLAASVYSIGYYKSHIKKHGDFELKFLRRYLALWLNFQFLLIVVLVANNIGLMWVALEATTLTSAFLIIQPANSFSIEAMWKYLMICSVGIAFGFIGTILTVAATQNDSQSSLFLFTELVKHSSEINPKIMLLAFIFIVAGMGTKAGLAPMHTWLPDAHSQAPTPVSAVFSGIMLNVALFGIMRYLSITELATGHSGQAHSILLVLGILSLVFAVIFIPIQNDIKRLLAYCSVEHIGIIAIGIAIGGFGTVVALLHIANHSISKVLAFFSAGHLVEHYETKDMRKIAGAVSKIPVWGASFLISMFVLIGVAPFSIFLSEFLLVKEAFFSGSYIVFGIVVFSTLVIFISILKNVLQVSFGSGSLPEIKKFKINMADKFIVVIFIAILLLLGLWIPTPFENMLKSAALIIENGVTL